MMSHLSCRVGMGMKSLKWEGIGTKNLFPHTSSVYQSSHWLLYEIKPFSPLSTARRTYGGTSRGSICITDICLFVSAACPMGCGGIMFLTCSSGGACVPLCVRAPVWKHPHRLSVDFYTYTVGGVA